MAAVALGAGALTAFPASAAAQSDAPTAGSLRAKARAAIAAGDTAGACQLFDQSVKAAVSPGSDVPVDDVLFELADCHEQLGRRAQAANEFETVGGSSSSRAEEAKRRAAILRAPPGPAPVPLPPAPPPGPATTNGTTGPSNGSTPPPPPPPPGDATTDVLPVAPVPPGSIETLTGGPPPTSLGNFMDTRLAWTFGDDDVLHATGLAYPLSQSFNIGDRPQYRLFFDDLNSRFTGRENLTHLALYKKMPGFIRKLDTEASMVVRLNLDSLATNTNNLNQALYDAGSYIRAFYHTDGNPDGKQGFGLTLWPIDTDRFRLGYLYAISWGGTASYINESIFPGIQGTAPGAKAQYDGDGWNIFVGFKTASIVQIQQTLAPGTSQIEQIQVQQTNLGALGGGAVDITENVHIDVNGGFFQQGKFTLPDVVGLPVWTAGFAGRLFLHHKDAPVPQSIDFLLYKNDPNKPMIIFKPEVYTPNKTVWQITAEYDNLFQNLKNFDVAGATKIQQAHAGALQANLKSGFFRGSLTGIYRDLPYVLRNQPSFIPFETMPAAAKTTPEFFFAAAADYYFEGSRLTPGIGAGLQVPATFESTSVNSASSPIDRTVVVREQGNLAILPVNQSAVPIIQARVSLKWDVSRILSAQIWVQYKRDNNATFVERDPSEGTVSLRTFINPNFLGMGSSVQARF